MPLDSVTWSMCVIVIGIVLVVVEIYSPDERRSTL